ncbi:MAG TPA: bifunctional metallophosphatase/5'-nucleotidase, partial [Candidatus Anaerofilum faecale]|nr:bifunctional metallophosphatase/5'-nucleotidase [Candidatus Anaerofilum faecale]
MQRSNRLMAGLLAAGVVLMAVPVAAADLPEGLTDLEGKLVVIHTNDTHGRDLEGAYTTAAVAQLKQDLTAAGADVLLLSAGDASQGTPLVNLSLGGTAIDFMNLAGYDAMATGNHEFDWGLENLQKLAQDAEFPILAANLTYTESGELVFGDSIVFTTDSGLKVGVFGLATPETATKAHPDKVKGVSFAAGQELYDVAQQQVDKLNAEGCDYIIALSHLGDSAESAPNRSVDLLDHVTGIDLMVDGHSHTTLPEGDTSHGDTLRVSTGEYLNNIGVVVYDAASDTETARLLSSTTEGDQTVLDYTGSDPDVLAAIEAVNAEVEQELGKVFAKTEVLLNGERDPGVRTEETNLGNFAADAILWSARQALGEDKVDLALTNGGGIRASIPVGDISMKTMKTVFPFGNEVATVTVTGAELLEALEAATFCTPTAVGAFPQVSGVQFTIDTTVPYENGEMYPNSTYYAPAKPGSRIKNVTVNGQPLDLNAEYVVATNDFTAAGGDTYGAFLDKPVYKTGVALEDALVQYTSTVLNGVISEKDYG